MLFGLNCRIHDHSLNSKNYYYYLSSCTEASDVFVLQSSFKAIRRLYIEIDISSLRRLDIRGHLAAIQACMVSK